MHIRVTKKKKKKCIKKVSKVSRDHCTMTDTFALSNKCASCVCFINPAQDAAMNKLEVSCYTPN